MTLPRPTPSDTIRNCLAFAYEAAETEEDRAWVNEGQEALAMMEGEVERLKEHAFKAWLLVRNCPSRKWPNVEVAQYELGEALGLKDHDCSEVEARKALAQPGDAA